MPARPEIFISATTKDLQSCRQLVRDALLTLGCVPVMQDHFAPEAATVREMLRGRIAACDAVIHLAGKSYGAEPQERAGGEPRRSYTQIEYDIARELKKPLYTFVCAPDFPYDAHESEDDERRALQDAHRAALATGDRLYVPLKDTRELSLRVRELQTRLEQVVRDQRRTRSWLARGVAAALVALLAVGGLLYVLKHRADQAGSQLAALRQEAENARHETEAMRRRLDEQTQVSTQILAAVQRLGPDEKRDPVGQAQSAVAKERGISVEDLQKQLADEKIDVRQLLARVGERRAAVQAQAAQWQKLQRDALLKLGDTEYASGHYRDAIEPYQQALALFDEIKEPLPWCDAAQKLEVALDAQGRYTEAEPLARRLMEKRTALQGNEHPDALISINNLAAVLCDKGDDVEAEALYRRCLEARERVLGKEHSDTLTSVNGLANTLEYRAAHTDAEPLYRRCLEARERTLGKEHPDTLRSVYNLSNVLAEEGDYVQAETLLRRALEAQERTLGKEHPDTLFSVASLAGAIDYDGDHVQAEMLLRRALEAQERTLGKDHPDTLFSAQCLAGVLFYDKADHAGAETVFRRVLEARERTLGKEHPGTLRAVHSLGELLYYKGDYTGAEALFRQALEAQERILGRERFDTLRSVNWLGIVLCAKGDYDGAETFLRRALEARERTLGNDNPYTLFSVGKLAQVMAAKGDDAAAESLYLRALAGMEKFLPPTQRDRLDLYYHFSLLRQKQGRLAEALPLAEHAVAGARKSLGANSPEPPRYEKNLQDLREKLAASAKGN